MENVSHINIIILYNSPSIIKIAGPKSIYLIKNVIKEFM